MRNCFVPGCDSFCKANDCVQRKMFSAPKAMIDQWRQVLPQNKREFKDNDRVCERHFQKDDITEFWENNIGGIIHRTKRDKPKLNANAIPSENLEVDCLKDVSTAKRVQRASKMKVVPKRPVTDILENNDDDDDVNIHEQFMSMKRIKNEDAEQAKRKSALTESTHMTCCSPIRDENEPLDEEKLEAFEMLYDEIHDVTLPSTVWGHHRCDERKFIVFSRFSDEKMSFNKFLFISERLTCKVFVNGKSRKLELEKDECNSEYISNWLEKIDEEE